MPLYNLTETNANGVKPIEAYCETIDEALLYFANYREASQELRIEATRQLTVSEAAELIAALLETQLSLASIVKG